MPIEKLKSWMLPLLGTGFVLGGIVFWVLIYISSFMHVSMTCHGNIAFNEDGVNEIAMQVLPDSALSQPTPKSPDHLRKVPR